jgi:hypothetical protein
MTRLTRTISWLSAARKDFEDFPQEARLICAEALTVAAEGGKADIAKPMKGMGSGVFEIALPHRGNAYRVSTPSSSVKRYGLFMRFRRSPSKASRPPNMKSIW